MEVARRSIVAGSLVGRGDRIFWALHSTVRAGAPGAETRPRAGPLPLAPWRGPSTADHSQALGPEAQRGASGELWRDLGRLFSALVTRDEFFPLASVCRDQQTAGPSQPRRPAVPGQICSLGNVLGEFPYPSCAPSPSGTSQMLVQKSSRGPGNQAKLWADAPCSTSPGGWAKRAQA